METFEVDDRVRLLSGKNFSNGQPECTIAKCRGDDIWLKETGTYVSANCVVNVTKRLQNSPQAFKADAGKPQWHLLTKGCPNALDGVVKVLSFAVAPKDQGGKGYVAHSWQEVPNAIERYESALHRHLNAINRGELVDSESKLSHWDHVATNALFLSELTKAANNDPQESK